MPLNSHQTRLHHWILSPTKSRCRPRNIPATARGAVFFPGAMFMLSAGLMGLWLVVFWPARCGLFRCRSSDATRKVGFGGASGSAHRDVGCKYKVPP